MKREIKQNQGVLEGKKKPAGKFLKSTVGIGAVVVIVALVMIIRGIGVQPSIIENKQTISELEAKIAAEKERQQEVDDMRENMDQDEYIEKIARDKLGMVKSDEIVFVDVAEK